MTAIAAPKVCIFVRTGEHEYAMSKIVSSAPFTDPLAGRGTKDVEVAARELSKLLPGVSGLYSSPLLRTLQTARRISEALDLPVSLSDHLRTRDYGQDNGRKFCNDDELRMVKREELETHNRHWETLESISERISVYFSESLGSGIYIAVTHKPVIHAALAYVLGKKEEELNGWEINYGSITGIDLNKKGPDAVLFFNREFLSEREVVKVTTIGRGVEFTYAI